MTPPQERAGDGAERQAGAADDQEDEGEAPRAGEDADVGHESLLAVHPRGSGDSVHHIGFTSRTGFPLARE